MPFYVVLKLTTQIFCGAFTDIEDAKASLVKAYKPAGQTCTFSNQGPGGSYCSVSNGDSYLIRQFTPHRQPAQLEGVQN